MVGGNPARVLYYRFDQELIDAIVQITGGSVQWMNVSGKWTAW